MSKIYELICECCGVDKITPENKEYVSEKLGELLMDSPEGLRREHIRRYKTFLDDPTPKQQEKLKFLYDYSDEKIPTKYCSFRNISINVLEDLGILEKVSQWYTKVNRSRLKEVYPDIEDFGNNKEPVKKRAKKGERIQQAVELLGLSSKEELKEEHIPYIDELSIIDFKLKGIRPPQTSMGKLKRTLIKIAKKNSENLTT